MRPNSAENKTMKIQNMCRSEMRTPLFFWLMIPLVVLLAAGCDGSGNPWMSPPDFTTVPELPDTSGIAPVEDDGGLKWYVIREGEGWSVQAIDIIEGFLTLRTADGEVRQSSWANGRTTPDQWTVANLPENATEGLYRGVLGMQLGERRVIVVPPQLGYEGLADTLVYDFELMDIHQR